MSSELTSWLISEAESYFMLQNKYLNEANSYNMQRKQKQFEQPSKLSTCSHRKRKRTPRQRSDLRYSSSMDRILQFSYTQVNRLGCRPEKQKLKEESNKTYTPNKKKSQINWSEGEESILNFYKKCYSYSSGRMLRTDKRELLRVAHEVQISNRIRRTCFPILKLPHNLTVQAPVGPHNHFIPRRTEIRRSSNAVAISKTSISLSPKRNAKVQKSQSKRRYRANNKISTEKITPSFPRYMQLTTINLKLEESTNTREKPLDKKTLVPTPEKRNALNDLKEPNPKHKENKYLSDNNLSDGDIDRHATRKVLLPEIYLNNYLQKDTKFERSYNSDDNCAIEILKQSDVLALVNKASMPFNNRSSSPNDTLRQTEHQSKAINKPKVIERLNNSQKKDFTNKTTNNSNTYIKLLSQNGFINLPQHKKSLSKMRTPKLKKLKVSDVLTKEDGYNLTIDKGGQLERFKVYLGSQFNTNKNINKDNNYSEEKPPISYINILQPVVVSTKSGTSFEMKPKSLKSPYQYQKDNIHFTNIYKEHQKLVPFQTPKT